MNYSYECPLCSSENQEDKLMMVIAALTFGFALIFPNSCDSCKSLVVPRWRNIPLMFTMLLLVVTTLYILLSIQS